MNVDGIAALVAARKQPGTHGGSQLTDAEIQSAFVEAVLLHYDPKAGDTDEMLWKTFQGQGITTDDLRRALGISGHIVGSVQYYLSGADLRKARGELQASFAEGGTTYPEAITNHDVKTEINRLIELASTRLGNFTKNSSSSPGRTMLSHTQDELSNLSAFLEGVAGGLDTGDANQRPIMDAVTHLNTSVEAIKAALKPDDHARLDSARETSQALDANKEVPMGGAFKV